MKKIIQIIIDSENKLYALTEDGKVYYWGIKTEEFELKKLDENGSGNVGGGFSAFVGKKSWIELD